MKPDQVPGKARNIDTTDLHDGVTTHMLAIQSQAPRTSQADVLDRLLTHEPVFDASGEMIAIEISPRIRLSAYSNDTRALRQADDTTLIAALYSLTENNRQPRYPLIASIDIQSLGMTDVGYLPPQHIIFVIAAPAHPDSKTILLLKARQQAGFRILLEQDPKTPIPGTLTGIIQEARIDTRQLDAEQIEDSVKRLRHAGMRKLTASHITCQEMQALCFRLKFDTFQGAYCTHTPPGKSPFIPVNRLTVLELIDHLNAGHQNDVEAIIKSNARLCYQLIACLDTDNPANHDISSVTQAIRLMTPAVMHNWLTLLLRTCQEPDAATQGALRRGLSRAHFLEMLAGKSLNQLAPKTAWLIGMLSVCDSLLQRPMEQCLAPLMLSNEVVQALAGHKGAGGLLLKLVIATENSDQAAIESLAARCLVSAEDVNLAMINALVVSEDTPF